MEQKSKIANEKEENFLKIGYQPNYTPVKM